MKLPMPLAVSAAHGAPGDRFGCRLGDPKGGKNMCLAIYSGWWFGTFFIWDVILPIDFHIFKMVKTTNQYFLDRPRTVSRIKIVKHDTSHT